MRHGPAVAAALLLTGTILPASAGGANDTIIIRPDQIEFKAPVSPGPSVSVLYGNPKEPGVYVVRVKFPKGIKIMPHWHPDVWRTAVVLSGTQYFGIGDKWDESKLTAFPPGTFFSIPPKTPHFIWAKDGDVIIQFTGMGPSGTTKLPPE